VRALLSGVLARAEELGLRALNGPRPDLDLRLVGDDSMDGLDGFSLFRGQTPALWNLASGQADDAGVSTFNFCASRDLVSLKYTAVVIRHPRLSQPAFSLRWVGWLTPPPRHARVAVPVEPGYSAYYRLEGPDPAALRRVFTPPIQSFFATRREVVAEGREGALLFARCRICTLGDAEVLVRDAFQLAARLQPGAIGASVGRVRWLAGRVS
jgi:hypothetical protein